MYYNVFLFNYNIFMRHFGDAFEKAYRDTINSSYRRHEEPLQPLGHVEGVPINRDLLEYCAGETAKDSKKSKSVAKGLVRRIFTALKHRRVITSDYQATEEHLRDLLRGKRDRVEQILSPSIGQRTRMLVEMYVRSVDSVAEAA